jgi:hypothetical protein
MRAIDLTKFNIIDLDSYGSPWEQAIIIADRRRVAPGALFDLVLTDCGLAYKNNVVSHAISTLTSIRPGVGGVVGLHKNKDALINLAIIGLARRMNCSIEKRWQAEGKSGAAMRYIGLVLKGKG